MKKGKSFKIFNFFFRINKYYFKKSENEVIIHGLGAAINRTVKLSLFIVRKSLGALYLSVNTSTVTLIDDYIPLKDVSFFFFFFLKMILLTKYTRDYLQFNKLDITQQFISNF